jgi:hypothetical protein
MKTVGRLEYSQGEIHAAIFGVTLAELCAREAQDWGWSGEVVETSSIRKWLRSLGAR